jgi:alanine dehydrogenase
MQRCIGVRREDKSCWERRSPVTPDVARELRDRHGIQVYVQPSATRVFPAAEFEEVGAIVQESLRPCPVVFAVKEIPPALFEPGKVYVFFAHVIKGQPHNMPMLRRLLDLGCTLIDYEKVTDDQGRRLIFFGRHAGVAGTLETLWALGRRLAWEGIPTPLADLRHAFEYRDAAEAKEAVSRAGRMIAGHGLPAEIAPLAIGVVGYGNVAAGAWEILKLLPIEMVEPAALASVTTRPGASRDVIYATTFREEHIVAPRSDLEPFDCRRYYECPDAFRPVFEQHVPHLTALVNGIYWDARYPRLITVAYLRELFAGAKPRLRVIGDVSCDIEGSIECTVRSTEPDEPVFVYNPLTGETTDGYEGAGVVVMAVDILPSELPRDASDDFSRVLLDYIPAIAAADYAVPYEELALPPEIKRAVIAHRGELAPSYRYIQQYL